MHGHGSRLRVSLCKHMRESDCSAKEVSTAHMYTVTWRLLVCPMLGIQNKYNQKITTQIASAYQQVRLRQKQDVRKRWSWLQKWGEPGEGTSSCFGDHFDFEILGFLMAVLIVLLEERDVPDHRNGVLLFPSVFSFTFFHGSSPTVPHTFFYIYFDPLILLPRDILSSPPRSGYFLSLSPF